MNRLIFGLIIIFVLESAILAEDTFYTTLSNALPQTVAMGGAATAVVSDPLSVCLNPATLRMFPLPGTTRGLIFFNPMGLHSVTNAINDVPDVGDQLANGARLLVRFVGVSHQFVDFGVRLSDEIPLLDDQDLLPDKDIIDFHTNTAMLRVKLHPYVSLGLMMIGNTRGNQIDQFSYSYGVLMRPGSKVEVGVSYIDYPARYQKVSHPVLRLVDETVNIGIAMHFTPSTIASVDLRNITDEGREAFLEPHFGFEQTVYQYLAIRGGGAVYSKSNRKMLSFGAGLFDWNQVFKRSRRLVVPNYALQYGVALEYIERLQRTWHTLSLCIRL